MSRTSTIAVCSVLCVTLVSGCATRRQTEQLGGAVLGGITGGLISWAAFGAGEEIGIGIGAGALTGWAVAFAVQASDSYYARSAEQDATRYAGEYPVPRTTVRIREAHVDQGEVRPGAVVRVATDYSLMAFASDETVEVEETFSIRNGEETLVSFQAEAVERTVGGWYRAADIAIPLNAAPGTYTIEHTVRAADSVATARSVLVVSS